MSIYLHKSHNVSVLLYHLVCVAKYRNPIFNKQADNTLKTICLEVEKKYEIKFLEIGTDKDHVHFLIQSVPIYSPTKIARTVKSITARELKLRMPELKRELWGAAVWTSGFFINTVGKTGSENVIKQYIQNQGNDHKSQYNVIHKNQLSLI